MNYIGIDQSYTSTGFVVLDQDTKIISCDIFSSNKWRDIYPSIFVLDLIGKLPNLQTTWPLRHFEWKSFTNPTFLLLTWAQSLDNY